MSDHRKPTTLPPAVRDFPPVAEQAAALDALEQRHKAEREKLRKAGHAIDAAKAADRAAYATALRDGKRDPGTPKTDKAQTELDRLKRLVAALDEARDGAARDLRTAVDEHRQAMLDEAQARFEQARERWADAVRDLAGVHRVMQDASATQDWLTPEGPAAQLEASAAPRSLPPRFTPGRHVAHVQIPISEQGSTSVAAILEGLANIGKAREPKPPILHAPPGAPGKQGDRHPLKDTGYEQDNAVGGRPWS